MVVATSAPAPDSGNRPEGHCSYCHKVWTLETGQGICRWCGQPASCQTTRANTRPLKSNSRQRRRQADHNGNGYDHLDGEWLTYYKVASPHANKAMAQDREDLLHTIILTLAVAERNNGHKPFTIGTMHRIASRAVADYWRAYYKVNSGLDCRHCSKAQRSKCKEGDLYSDCPKAIRLEYLSKPIVDGEGNLTELGELIADPKSLDLDAWERDYLWQIGYKPRLVDIALKLHRGEALSIADRKYLCKYRHHEQKRLI